MVAGLSSDGKVVYELSVPEVNHPEAIVTALQTESNTTDQRFALQAAGSINNWDYLVFWAPFRGLNGLKSKSGRKQMFSGLKH